MKTCLLKTELQEIEIAHVPDLATIHQCSHFSPSLPYSTTYRSENNSVIPHIQVTAFQLVKLWSLMKSVTTGVTREQFPFMFCRRIRGNVGVGDRWMKLSTFSQPHQNEQSLILSPPWCFRHLPMRPHRYVQAIVYMVTWYLSCIT